MVEIDGTTAYVQIDPAGIGPTVERALAADRAGDVRHVAVCGPRPGAGKTGAQSWAEQRGSWFLTAPPHVTRSALRVNLARDGRRVHVSRVEPWFGERVTPADAAEAMRVVRHVTAALDVRPFGTPGQTGRKLLRASWASAGKEYPSPPADVAELLRSTSGQGRFQVFPNAGGVELVGVDARFQYGALAMAELPIGPAYDIDSPPPTYAPSWCQVEFAPNGGPVGMLGVESLGRWHWPTDGGPYLTWCTGAELLAAQRAGYRVQVRRALIWLEKARPLAPLARLLDTERQRISGLPLRAGVIDAARGALRAILVQSVGSLHGKTAASPSLSASADKEGGAAVASDDHPEWTVAIWGAARARLAAVMAEQSAPVVACALDGFYVAGEPELRADDGRAGKWREVWRGGPWPAIANMADIYALRGEQ